MSDTIRTPDPVPPRKDGEGDKGTITVSARHHEDRDAVELAVADTGIGIAPEDRQQIFEPFRQAASGDDKGYGGVGLGLALVARLANLLSVSVELDSVVGKGSTFRVIVPISYTGKRSTKLMRAVAWSMADRAEELMSAGGVCCLAFTPKINSFNDYETVEIVVDDFRPGPLAELV